MLRALTGPARAASVTALLAGCAFSHIDLVQDHRVALLSPSDGSTVSLPVTVQWRTRGLPPSAQVAVFLDRQVIPPGAALRSIAADDQQCLRNPACPDATYLRGRGIYVVQGETLTLPFLPDLRNAAAGVHTDEHTVTVVLLEAGHRAGESGVTSTFTVRRRATA